VQHDVDVDRAALGIDAQGRERSEVRSRAVGVQELVAVPLRHDQVALVGEEQADAGGRKSRLEATELGPAEGHPLQARRSAL
jgi:hypothetical protein